VKIKGNEKYEFYSIQLQCHSTSHSTQPNPSHMLENATQPKPNQPMDGPNPCPSLCGILRHVAVITQCTARCRIRSDVNAASKLMSSPVGHLVIPQTINYVPKCHDFLFFTKRVVLNFNYRSDHICSNGTIFMVKSQWPLAIQS